MKKLSIILTGLLIALNSSNILSMYGYYSYTPRPWYQDKAILTQCALLSGLTAFTIWVIKNDIETKKAAKNKKFDIKNGMYLIKLKGCGACNAAIPVVEKIKEDFKNKKIAVNIVDSKDQGKLGISHSYYPAAAYINNYRLYKVQDGGITYTNIAETLNEILNIAAKTDFGDTSEKPADVAVIGAGPAGSSAANYSARNKLKTMLFGKQTDSNLAGVKEVNNWSGMPAASGAKLSFDLWNEAMNADVNMCDDNIVDIDNTKQPFTLKTDNGKQYFSQSVILATGKTPRKPNIPGIKDYWGKGVAICSLCDAATYKDKNVMVYGQQDISDTLNHLAQTAKTVTLVIPEDKIDDPAIEMLVKEKNKFRTFKNTELASIDGNNAHITNVKLKLGKNNNFITIDNDAVFIGLGSAPNNALAKKLNLELDDNGYVKVQPTQATSLKGIFAAGDITNYPYKQAFLASSQGLSAAMSAYKYLAMGNKA